MALKRQLSLSDIDTLLADGKQQSYTQVAKRGRKGVKNNPTLSQPTQPSNSSTDDNMIPVESCVVCNEEASRASSIQCDSCGLHYHLNCCLVDEADHPVIIRLISVIGWVCKICRDDTFNEINKLRIDLSRLESKLNDANSKQKSQKPKTFLESNQSFPSLMRSNQEANNPVTNSAGNEVVPGPVNYASMVQLVRKSVKDVNQRQRNIVISGLKEIDGVDDAEIFS